jgi:hypothetical protein
VCSASERLDVERLRIITVDPVTHPTQPCEVEEVLCRGWE